MKYLMLLYGLFLLPWLSSGQSGDSVGFVRFQAPDGIEMLNINANSRSFLTGRYDLKDYLYVLVDSTGELTFSESSSSEYAHCYVPFSEVSLVNLSLSRYVYWLRLSIQFDLDQEQEWLTNYMEAEVVAYSKANREDIGQKRCGVLVPASERYFNKQYGQLGVLPITLPANNSRHYYWRIQSQPVFVETEHGAELNFTLLSHPYLSNFLQIEAFVFALFLGFYLAVGIYHLVIFSFSKDWNYLWFFCFCLATAFLGIVNLGYDLQYLWPEKPFAHYYLIRAVALIIWNLFLIIFSRSFLQMARLTPAWDRAFLAVFGLAAFGFLVGTPTLWFSPALGLILVRLGQSALIIQAVLLLIIPLISIGKGHQPAKLFLLANVAFLIGFILTMLNTMQILPGIDHVNWIQFGGGVQLFLFAFGLSQLFRQYELQRHLDQAEAFRLKELDRVKTQLYTNITHEFRTPLTVISGMAEQIKNPPESKELIHRNTQQMLRLVNQMLDFAKLETGNLPVKMIQADIVTYLQYLLESFHSYAATKQVGLHFYEETQQRVMDFDEEKLQSIVSNLLSNAIKFSPGGGKVVMHVKEEERGKENRLVLKVKDRGMGISPEKLPRIFDRFYQADDSHTRKEEGAGIGLALTKELVELMGGSVQVKSTPGEGSEFTVILPISHDAPIKEVEMPAKVASFLPVEEKQEPANEKDSTRHEDQPLLLVIEDNRDVITYIRTCLRKFYHIEVAQNGVIGIEKALNLVPDIIISDVMMPEKDGFEVCATLKQDERTSHIPIILLTAKADMDSRIEGLERGADAYLAKPFEKRELLVRLQQLVELRRRLQQRYAGGAMPAPSTDKGIQMEDAFLLKIHRLVEEHLDDSGFGIAELCRALLLSRMQVHRKLKALTGRSASHIIRSIRLQKARELLQTTELTISEIAYDTGFTDPNHFSRVFKEEFGKAPSGMRE